MTDSPATPATPATPTTPPAIPDEVEAALARMSQDAAKVRRPVDAAVDLATVESHITTQAREIERLRGEALDSITEIERLKINIEWHEEQEQKAHAAGFADGLRWLVDKFGGASKDPGLRDWRTVAVAELARREGGGE